MQPSYQSTTPEAGGYITTSSPAPVSDQTKITPTENNDSLSAQVQQRGRDLGASLGMAGEGLSGLLNKDNKLSSLGQVGSGLLQSAGAIAGTVGDVTNKAIEQIPGVKALEGLIGDAVGGYLGTDSGKKWWNTYKNQHKKILLLLRI